MVLATVGSSSKSELEFWDLDFNSDDANRREGQNTDWGSGIQLLGTADHYGVTDVEWDPSGRYFATSASAWTHTVRWSYQTRVSSQAFSPLARKWLCNLGLPWTRTNKTNTRQIQTIYLATPPDQPINKRKTEASSEEPPRVQSCIRRRRCCRREQC